MGGETVTEVRAKQQTEQLKKLIEELSKVTDEGLSNFSKLAPDLPPSKAAAIQGHLKVVQQKVEVIAKIYGARDIMAELERAKREHEWLKVAAKGLDLTKLTMEVIQSAADANLKLAALIAAKRSPESAVALAKVSEKLAKYGGATVAAVGTIAEAIRLIDAIQRRDTQAIISSAGGVASGTVSVTLLLTETGSGAGPAMVIQLWVDGIIAAGRLGGILKQIRVEKERRSIWQVVEKAERAAGLARSITANQLTWAWLLNTNPVDAEFIWAVMDAECRHLAACLYDLANRIDADLALAKGATFPRELLKKAWDLSTFRDAFSMPGKADIVQEVLNAAAGYLVRRLCELEVFPEKDIPREEMAFRIRWKI